MESEKRKGNWVITRGAVESTKQFLFFVYQCVSTKLKNNFFSFSKRSSDEWNRGSEELATHHPIILMRPRGVSRLINCASSSNLLECSIYTNELMNRVFLAGEARSTAASLMLAYHLGMDSSDRLCWGWSWWLDSLSTEGFLLNNRNDKLWIRSWLIKQISSIILSSTHHPESSTMSRREKLCRHKYVTGKGIYSEYSWCKCRC